MAFLVICFWWSLASSVMAYAAEAPQVIDIAPGRLGNTIVCQVATIGLPAEKQLQSMRSGLVSSVEFDLALLDQDNRFLGGNTLTLRLAFDLWEEVFSVRKDGRERHFDSLADLVEYLSDLPDLPVFSTTSLDQNQNYRLKVAMVVNPIAADEQERMEEVISGDQRPQRQGQDQQEASVSLGRLIRFFYKGSSDDRGSSERLSGLFTLGELNRETN